VARVFDHPNPSVSLPSRNDGRGHVVEVEGGSLEDAKQLLEDALAARLGTLEWVRWHAADGRSPGRR